MTATPSCPYCNAVVAVPAGTRAGQFVPCPRCGERFPYRGPAPEENGTPPPPTPQLAVEPLVDRVGERLRRWPKHTVALTVVGVMVLMAAGGLALALLTQSYRRANDRLPPPDESAARVRVVAPADLAGLGYLPPDTDLIAAVHVAEALREPAGKEFLRHFRPEDVARGPRGPVLAGDLEQWTGLRLDDLDHVVLGLKLAGGAIPPRAVLVAQTRRRYDAGKILTALHARRDPEARTGRQLFRFHVERLGQTPALWFAAEHTVVVALTPEQMAEVPETPQPGGTHLAAPLQEVLGKRLGAGTQAWVVGHAEDWEKTTAKLALALLPPDDHKLLDGMRTFGLGLRFADGLTLNGTCRCADAAAARKLEKRLAPPEGSERRPPLFGALANAGPVARELVDSLKVVREDDWLMLQAKAGREALGGVPASTGRTK